MTAIQKHSDDTNLIASPQQDMKFAVESAKLLKQIVSQNNWTTKIQGKDYLGFEAWQTLARFYGYTVKTAATRYVEYGTAKGFEAKSEVLNREGVVIGGAEAVCLNDEYNWKGKPIFSLKSMAQTRASAKALRQILSWVVVLAGFAPTPTEDMPQESYSVEAKPQKKEPEEGQVVGDNYFMEKKKEALVGFVTSLNERGKVALQKDPKELSIDELENIRQGYMKSIGK